MSEKKTKTQELMYDGKPIVRCGNILYFGDVTQRYFCTLQIISNKNIGELQVAEKVVVQLICNDPGLSAKDRVIKKGIKDGLFPAVEIGAIWINQYTAAKA